MENTDQEVVLVMRPLRQFHFDVNKNGDPGVTRRREL
jgi:hypothetical protein